MQDPVCKEILDHSSYGVIGTNMKGKIVYVNQKARESIQFTELLTGDLHINHLLPKTGSNVREAIENQQPYWGQLLEEGLDHIILSVNVIKDHGEPVGAACNIFDINEFREFVQDPDLINVFDKKFETVFESAFDGIWLCDGKGRVLKINRAAERNLTVPRSEIIGKKTSALIDMGLYDNSLANEVIQTKRKVSQTQTSLVTNKQILCTGIPVFDENGDVSLVVVNERDLSQLVATQQQLEDLTEQLAIEKQLREAQTKIEQTEKMASLGRLAAGIAHEINNPLTSILLNGNILREKLPGDHKLSQSLDYVIEDARRCQDIVKNLLDYSRQSSPRKDTLDINMLVSESLGLLHDPHILQGVEIVSDLAEKQIMIRANKNQLCQVVINLIINAVDAMEQMGRITFRTHWQVESGKAFLEVADTGPGIPTDDIAKIFDPFYTTKELGKGTGLGLSMAYSILEKNQGRIFIKETGPQGTTFALELPVVTLSKEMPPDLIG